LSSKPSAITTEPSVGHATIQLPPYSSLSLFLDTKILAVPSRRLEDKIRHACCLALAAESDDAWLNLFELRMLLHEHVERLRTVAAEKLSGKRECFERRSSDGGSKNQANHTPSDVPPNSTPFPDQESVRRKKLQKRSATDLDGPAPIGGKAQT